MKQATSPECKFIKIPTIQQPETRISKSRQTRPQIRNQCLKDSLIRPQHLPHSVAHFPPIHFAAAPPVVNSERAANWADIVNVCAGAVGEADRRVQHQSVDVLVVQSELLPRVIQ